MLPARSEKTSMLQPLLRITSPRIPTATLVELCLMVYRGRLDYRVITAPAL